MVSEIVWSNSEITQPKCGDFVLFCQWTCAEKRTVLAGEYRGQMTEDGRIVVRCNGHDRLATHWCEMPDGPEYE
jgi:hypothetical protein